MTTHPRSALSSQLRPVMASLKVDPLVHGATEQQLAEPFVTITRQPWAGGWSLAQRLVDHLNASSEAEPKWTCWDRELIEKVAADHHISQRLIETLEDSYRSWLSDFFDGMRADPEPGAASELKIYHRVAETVRALAQAGRVVIVGRGGVFITRGMPGGVHIRLVAPLEVRIRTAAERLNVSPRQAAAEVERERDNRMAFYQRYWPGKTLDPETFDAVFDTARLSEEVLVEMVTEMIRSKQNARAGSAI